MKKHLFHAILLRIILAPALLGLLVMLLWNALLPQLLGVPAIGYGQAVGLFFLTHLLFGGIGPLLLGGLVHAPSHRHAEAIRNRWAKMSDEERRAFIERARQRRADTPFGRNAGENRRNDAARDEKHDA